MSKILIKVPQLLKERGLGPMDLMYGARIAPGTAYTLADEEKSQRMTAMSFDVLGKLCHFFSVGIADILEFQENGNGQAKSD